MKNVLKMRQIPNNITANLNHSSIISTNRRLELILQRLILIEFGFPVEPEGSEKRINCEKTRVHRRLSD